MVDTNVGGMRGTGRPPDADVCAMCDHKCSIYVASVRSAAACQAEGKSSLYDPTSVPATPSALRSGRAGPSVRSRACGPDALTSPCDASSPSCGTAAAERLPRRDHLVPGGPPRADGLAPQAERHSAGAWPSPAGETGPLGWSQRGDLLVDGWVRAAALQVGGVDLQLSRALTALSLAFLPSSAPVHSVAPPLLPLLFCALVRRPCHTSCSTPVPHLFFRPLPPRPCFLSFASVAFLAPS